MKLLDLLGIAVSVAWLVVVGSSYAAVMLFPAPTDAMTLRSTPPDLSTASLPLLAAILILGIIRTVLQPRLVPTRASLIDLTVEDRSPR
jgi:hypothetical protein